MSVKRTTSKIDLLVEDLKTALSKAWDRQTREYMLSLLDYSALGDTITGADIEYVQEMAASFLGTGLEEAARRPVINLTDRAYAHGKSLAAIDYALKAKDIESMKELHRYGFFWVGQTYDRFVSKDVQGLLREYFDKGLTCAQLAEGMSILMRDRETPRMRGYFELLADHLTTKVAEMGHLSGYEEAGVEYVEIVARLDDRTTDICRHLHGRVIPIGIMQNQRNRILDAAHRGDMEAAKSAQPMIGSKRTQDILSMGRTSNITAQGIGLPPYHFRCRTTTAAHFQPADYTDRVRQWAYDGDVPKKEVGKLLDLARNSHWGTHKQIFPKRHGGDGRAHPVFMVHAAKHGKNSELNMTPTEYNQGVMNLIRRADREAYLVIMDKRHPHPVLYFRDPKTREFAVVNVDGKQIATYHIVDEENFSQKLRKCEIALQISAKGVMKWKNVFAG